MQVDQQVLERTIGRFRERRILLPTFAQLAAPHSIPRAAAERLAGVDPQSLDPANLFRLNQNILPAK